MEHRLIIGGEEYLPFARSCITKLKKLGLSYADQSYEVNGVSIKVRIEPGHEYIRIEGGAMEYTVSANTVAGNAGYRHVKLTSGAAVSKKKVSIDRELPTDWKGESGQVVTYFNGCPCRYRLDYPSEATPAGEYIRYGGVTYFVGKQVLGAAAVSVPPQGEKKIIFASTGTALSAGEIGVGSSKSVNHVTEFFYFTPGELVTPEVKPVGRYAPVLVDTEFGKLDIREEPQAPEFPDVTIPTYPDPWFFSPDGCSAVSAIIEPNFRLLRRGFIANVRFSVTADAVTVEYVGATDHTYDKSFYPGWVEVSNTLTPITVVPCTDVIFPPAVGDAEGGWTGVPSTWFPRPFTSSVGTRKLAFDGRHHSLLLGGDYKSDGTVVSIVAKIDEAAVQYGDYSREADSGSWTYSWHTVSSFLDEIWYTLACVRTYHGYRLKAKITDTQERICSIFYGGELIASETQSSLTDNVGRYSARTLLAYQGEPYIPVPGVNGLPPNILTVSTSTITTERTRDRKSRLMVISKMDARIGALLYFTVGDERSGDIETSSDGVVWAPATNPETTMSVGFTAVGLASREQVCLSRESPEYTFLGANSLSSYGSNTPYTGAAYTRDNPWFVANGYGSPYFTLAWASPKGSENAVLASASDGEWVYGVAVNTVTDNLVQPIDTAAELVDGQQIQTSFAARKTEVTEKKIAAMRDSPDVVGVLDVKLIA